MKRFSVVKNWIHGSFALLAFLFFVGCSGEQGHNHSEGHSHGHAHHAPHGGALTMLGNHAFQLELLPNPEEGRLGLYVLDGGAENFVRVANEGFEGVARFGGEEWTLRFTAVANAATGESVGDSSYFVAEAEAVSKLPKFDLTFAKLEIRGQVFESVTLPYPEGAH